MGRDARSFSLVGRAAVRQSGVADAACKSGSSRAVMATGSVQSRVWQKGYHDRAVRREEDLRHIARYIVANPLRAGLVRKVGDYPLWDAIWL